MKSDEKTGFLGDKTIVVLNAISIFPLIAILSSMKMIMAQNFNIKMQYSTIIGYAGMISAMRFIFVSAIDKYKLPFLPKTIDNYRQWIFAGGFLMSISLVFIYITLALNPFHSQLTLMIVITALSTLIVGGESIYDAAVSVFYTNYSINKARAIESQSPVQPQDSDSNHVKNAKPSQSSKEFISSSIFIGHKLAALIGYFLFPFAVYLTGIHLPFICLIVLSFALCFTSFYLPTVEIADKDNKIAITPIGIFRDIKNTPQILLILLFATTCQLSTLILNGIKCNFIILISEKKLLSYLLRGLSIIVGLLGGYLTHSLRRYIQLVSKIDGKNRSNYISFFIAGIMQLLAVIVNYVALINQTTYLLIFSVIIENLSKGFLMYCLNYFFLSKSFGKPHLLTFFWGYYQIVRSLSGGISGSLLTVLGTEKFLGFLIILAIPPIILPFFLENNE